MQSPMGYARCSVLLWLIAGIAASDIFVPIVLKSTVDLHDWVACPPLSPSKPVCGNVSYTTETWHPLQAKRSLDWTSRFTALDANTLLSYEMEKFAAALSLTDEELFVRVFALQKFRKFLKRKWKLGDNVSGSFLVNSKGGSDFFVD